MTKKDESALSEPHHFLKIDQIVNKCLVALMSERHI